MSRKSKRNRPANEPRRDGPRAAAPAAAPAPAAPTAPSRGPINRTTVFVTSAIALVVVFVVLTLVYRSEKAESAQAVASQNVAALASEHAPLHGKADAKVHIVEFVDPACETCATFFPLVKRIVAENPDKIRLSMRHVPFHQGSDQVVRVLEAARAQDKYWQALEALFANQGRWTANHTVLPDQVWPSLASAGLDIERLKNDMISVDITRRMDRDMADAKKLGVTKTPEYFVNGRPMPSFGLKQLQDLVAEELKRAYP